MATFRPDYLPPSNRRRCVKGRSSYTDSSDLYLSAAVNQDQNSTGFSQNEDSYIDSVRSDDGEEEDITIDLSAFLNDNPLLAEAAFESASEDNIASTESSSQFRVTDCKVDPSEIPKAAVTDPLLSVDVNGDTSVGRNNSNENIVGPHAAAIFIQNNTKENCLSPEKTLINVTNNEPAQSVTLNDKKSVVSPTKKFSRALGLSNPLKKYKNFMKSKNLNEVNEKVFGKYPIVKCQKLDIENFVKNNKIKIRNWPLLQTESKKSNSVNKGTIKRKVNLNKGNLKPKFMKKPINFNKHLIASNKDLANQNISNILGDQPDVSKPIIIKTDSWKPGVTNVSSCVPSFFRPLTKTSLSTSKNVVCDLLKLNDKTVGRNVISSPEKKCDIKAKTVATSINKLFNSPKSYPLIAPKPCSSSPNIHPITTTKPLIETLTTSVTDNFTVIEPYVDDPTSPQKPKPILTVPVEVVPSPEKQNPVINSSLISSVDIITNANNSEKLLKKEKSVFLNDGIKKIIVPTKTDVSISKKEIVHRKINQEKLLKEVVPKVPVVLKVKDVSSEESASVLKAKNIVLEAMKNVFSSTQIKTIPKKSVRPVKKPTCDLTSGNSIIGSSAFSSILNDNILNGFSENDFEDVSLFDDDSFTDSTQEMSPPSKSLPDKVNVVTEDSGLTPKSIKKAREQKIYKRKKSSDIFTKVSSYLPNKDSKDTMLSSADEIKNSESDSDSCESLIKENNSTVIGVLPALEVENSKDIPLSVELINETNSFSNINDSNDILNENLHNICDVTFDSTVNQTNENEFEETENTLEENIAVNPEMSVENEVFEDFVHEETVIEEVVTMEICDDSEQMYGNPDVSICVDDEDDKSNLVHSIDSPEESASNPSSTDIIIEEKDIDSSDVPSNDIQIDKNKAEINDTCHQFKKDFKRSVSFPDNSSLTEKEALVVEESNNTSSDPTNDISENISHQLNEKCEDFFVNSLLLKSNNEDKITVSEEIADLTDASSNNLTTENVDNRQFNTVSLNLSCSDTTSEKEILNTEISSTNEDQKTGCQVNEASLNVSCVSNETFEAESDISIMNSDEVSDSKTEKEILSIEKDSDKNQKSSSIENKKCPKIKLFKKSDADSPDSLKSVFVSENSEKEVKSAISNEAFETKSDNINSLNSDETPDLHVSSGLDDNSSVNSENHKSNIEGDSYVGIHNAVLPEKENSKSSCNFEAGSPSLSNLLSDKNVLTKIEEISCKSHSVEKSNHTEEMSLPNNKVPSENINETISENLLPLDHVEQSKALRLREKENYDSPVIIKELMDIEENTESSSSYVLEEKSIKTERLPNKRKRGMPRKSIEYCNTSLNFGDDLVIPRIEKTTVPVIPEVKEEDVTPKREIKITSGAHSAGHKRKNNPVQASTPSSSRKKNYDPELVRLPFSMGWMREHVIRATGKDNKRQSDIYYFSPEGTKLRSMPDILTYLSKHPHIKLSAVNFTFAKELIYHEPFEIERDAKQPSAKKICATPTAKKPPSKALISLADNRSDKLLSVESKKKLTLKHKRSSSYKRNLPAEDQDIPFSSSNTFKKSKQLPLAELLTGNSNKTEDKPSRPSRRIVKKIPFDPSISSVPEKSSKSTSTETLLSRTNIKLPKTQNRLKVRLGGQRKTEYTRGLLVCSDCGFHPDNPKNTESKWMCEECRNLNDNFAKDTAFSKIGNESGSCANNLSGKGLSPPVAGNSKQITERLKIPPVTTKKCYIVVHRL